MIGLHKKITDLFLSNQVKGNEYSICIKIASMWNLLISNFHSSGNSTSINLLRQQRLQSILLFIYAHYADDLQLSDLAASANISVGECCRIFQNILHTTPYGYLTNYRIQTSVSLLHRDLPISQIAGLVGYNQVSNYIATFKRIIGYTPAQYRKQQKNESEHTQ